MVECRPPKRGKTPSPDQLSATKQSDSESARDILQRMTARWSLDVEAIKAVVTENPKPKRKEKATTN